MLSRGNGLIVEWETGSPARALTGLVDHERVTVTEVSPETTSTLVALRQALQNNELRLHYQPRISLTTDRMVGVEALLRWERPGHGLVSPAELINADELGEIAAQIGSWTLREACRQGAAWRAASPRHPVQIAVGVPASIFRGGLGATLHSAIAESGIGAGTVCVEVTGTTVMSDIDATVELFEELNELGLAVSIADFGACYSSLQYLHRIPIEGVKIAGTFVAGLGSNRHDTAIVASVIGLAHALDLDVVAVGVETAQQLDRLRSLACDVVQGRYIGPPVPAADIGQYLATDAAGVAIVIREHDTATAGRHSGHTVLVVGDSTDMVATKASLTAAGYWTEEASSSAAALAHAARVRPDCLVLDAAMPGMSGVDVCRRLRADPHHADCAIVMVAADADAADKAEAFLVGADEYMVKPFSHRDLVSRVNSAISRRQATTSALLTQIDSVLVEMLGEARDGASDLLRERELLTTRQVEILKRLLAGDRVPAIARDLFVSQSTVRNHLSSIFQRLGVHSQEELLKRLRGRHESLAGH